MDQVVDRIEDAGKGIENFIFDEYNVSTIEDALAEVERLQSAMVRVLLFLTERIKA